MVITRLTGGLGNQMFQYAVGLRVALANSAPLKLDVSSYRVSPHRYQLDYLNISAETLPLASVSPLSRALGRTIVVRAARRLRREVEGRLHVHKTPVFRDPGHFDPDVLSLPGDVCLDGYWQSERYFSDIADVVREEFACREEPDQANREMATQIMDCESVNLHIRRGDYVSNPLYNQVHGTCSMSYYETSVARLAEQIERPRFFVFSDDIEWARENLDTGFPTVYVDINGPETDYEDMRLMSLCKHHIIANSTFSWWGAWLSGNPNKIIYAPAKWFESTRLDSSDIVPPQWQRVA